jgi:hypothetical protein
VLLPNSSGQFTRAALREGTTMGRMSDLSVIVAGVIVGSASGIGGTILGSWMTGHQHLDELHYGKYSEVLWQGRWCLLLQS